MSIAQMIFPDVTSTTSSSRTISSGLAAISILFTTPFLFRELHLTASASQVNMLANMVLMMPFATSILKIENLSTC